MVKSWGITTCIAIVTAAFDLGILGAGVFHLVPLSLSIIGIGIGTFFGMLASSKYQSIGGDPEKDKGHMRTALTGMLICVYVSIVVLTLTGDFNTGDIAKLTDSAAPHRENNLVAVTNASSTAIAISPGESNQNKIIDNFTNVIMVIVGFYFGSKAFTEIVSKIKDNRDSADAKGGKDDTDDKNDKNSKKSKPIIGTSDEPADDAIKKLQKDYSELRNLITQLKERGTA